MQPYILYEWNVVAEDHMVGVILVHFPSSARDFYHPVPCPWHKIKQVVVYVCISGQRQQSSVADRIFN
jgi:hypothetical protein